MAAVSKKVAIELNFTNDVAPKVRLEFIDNKLTQEEFEDIWHRIRLAKSNEAKKATLMGVLSVLMVIGLVVLATLAQRQVLGTMKVAIPILGIGAVVAVMATYYFIKRVMHAHELLVDELNANDPVLSAKHVKLGLRMKEMGTGETEPKVFLDIYALSDVEALSHGGKFGSFENI